jgi:prepilin-type N-terminal cleavage/methylation domain-containing protein
MNDNMMKESIIQNTDVSVLLVGGFGHAVWVFDEWLRDHAEVRLVGAVQTLPDESLEGFLAHPWAAQFKPAIYQNIDEALRAEKPDIVVISTRPDLNPVLIEKSLRAGCHVISEKPIAVDEAGLLRVHAAVEATGKFVLPMLGMHEVPAFTEARDLVAQGAIGEPLLVNARKSYQWGTRAEWFKQRETYGGLWGWIGIHSFNHAAYIIGRNATKVLAAQEKNRCHPEYAPGSADCMTGLFLLEDDVQMTVSVDLMRPDGQQAWGDDWVRIVGSEGSLEANPELGTIRLIRKGHDEELRKVTAVAPSFYTEFLSAVTENADFSELTAQGFRLTESVLTAERACVEERFGLEVKQARWALSLPGATPRRDLPRTAQKVKAFTLIELLTVIAIISVLAGILIPAISGVRDSATKAKCVSRLRALGSAANLFATEHQGQFPTNGASNSFSNLPDDQKGYGRAFDLLRPFVQRENTRTADLRVSELFNCPVHDDAGDFGQKHHYRFSVMVGMRNAEGTGFNNQVSTPLRLAAATHPDSTPYQWCVSGEAGGVPYLPTPEAAGYGWQGPTAPGGMAPNHGSNCMVLYLSGRVAPVDLSNDQNELFRDGLPTNVWAEGSMFDPVR